MGSKLLALVSSSLLLTFACQSNSKDRALIYKAYDNMDHRQAYYYELIEKVLKVSADNFGEYSIEYTPLSMTGQRQLHEMKKGELITITVSPYKDHWRESLLRVPFPLQKGISSYRVFFLLEKNKDILKGAQSIAALRKFRQGSRDYWLSTKIFKQNKLPVVFSDTYKGLFSMLQEERFELLLRGINEASIEYKVFKKNFPKLSIDPYVIVFFYMPNYFYVSPNQPQLAERIEYGLKKIHRTGEFEILFQKFFGEVLKSYDIPSRSFIKLNNSHIDPSLFIADQPYLLNFSKVGQ